MGFARKTKGTDRHVFNRTLNVMVDNCCPRSG
jgi:hypothetical protein